MRILTSAKKFNIFRGKEAGVSLIETVIALALLGLISAAFLSGLATGSKGTVIADEQATAESLVRSEIEYIKNQAYIDYADPGHGSYTLITTPGDYSVEVTVIPLDPDTGLPLGPNEDQSLQKITVTAKRNGNSVLTIADYKVDR